MSLPNLVDLLVPALFGQVGHHLERDHRHAQLVLVLGDRLLRVVRSVERLARRVDSGARMVPPDYQVIGAEVAPDDRVPQGLPGSAKAHRKLKE